MAEKYYRVAESDLVGIADAIRFQKKSEKKYLLKDFAKIIKAMLVLPSGSAETSVAIETDTDAVGILPTVYKGVARSSVNITTTTTAEGVLME